MTMSAPQTEMSSLPVAGSRMLHLDGLRGAAALYVALFHASNELISWSSSPLPGWLSALVERVFYGNASVDVFIVLSGYCLMLPVARTSAFEIPGGLGRYFVRRARRILPGYFAAYLLLTALLIAAPEIRSVPDTGWTSCLPTLSPQVVVSHLLLFHNLFPSWQLSIDMPLWSVATEWQIYFLFPLVLLPIWKRYNTITLVLFAFALGVGLAGLGVPAARYWFICLFALGMVAARLSTVNASEERHKWWLFGSIVAFAIGVVAHALNPLPSKLIIVVGEDLTIGASTAFFLAWLAFAGENTVAVKFLCSRAMLAVGAFSYSLYLWHMPVVAVMHFAAYKAHFSVMGTFAVEMLLATPLALVVSYIAYRLFEQPWMAARR